MKQREKLRVALIVWDHRVGPWYSLDSFAFAMT